METKKLFKSLKRRLCWLMTLLVLLATCQDVWAFANEMGPIGVYLNVNNSSSWYGVYKPTWTYNGCPEWAVNGTTFNSKDFGTVTTFKLGGLGIIGYRNDTDDWVAAEAQYQVDNGSTGSYKVGKYYGQGDNPNAPCGWSNDYVVGWKNSGTGDDKPIDLLNGIAPGEHTLKIQPNCEKRDPNGGSYDNTSRTKVSATFTVPGFSPATGTKEFGNVNIGENKEETINLTHYGSDTGIKSSTIEGTNADQFSTSDVSSSSFKVKFSPTSTGEKTAKVIITDNYDKTYELTVTGTGVQPTYYAVGDAFDGGFGTFHEMNNMGDGTYRIQVPYYDDKPFKITSQPNWGDASEAFYNDGDLDEGPNAYIYCWLSNQWSDNKRGDSYIKECQSGYGNPVYLYINPTTKKIWAEATSQAITIEDLYIRGPLVDGNWPDADDPASYHKFTKDGDTFTIKLYGSGGGGGEAGKFVLTTDVGEAYRIPTNLFNLTGCHGDTDPGSDARYNFISDLTYDEEEGYVLTVSITLVGGKYSLVVAQKTLPVINNVTPGSRCGTGTVGLSATATAGEGTVSIKWYAAATGGTALGTTASGATWTTPSINTTTTYYAEAVDDNFASKERSAVTATVNLLPEAGTINAGASVCKGSTVTLNVTNPSSASVQWQNSSKEDISGATNTSYTTPALQENTDYYVKFTDSNNCSSTSEKGTATVKDASLSIKASTATVNPYTVVTLTAKDNNNADKASDWTITGTGSYLVNATSKEVYTSNPTEVSTVVLKPAAVATTVTATATVDDCEATGTYIVTPTADSEDCSSN